MLISLLSSNKSSLQVTAAKEMVQHFSVLKLFQKTCIQFLSSSNYNSVVAATGDLPPSTGRIGNCMPMHRVLRP